MVSKELTARYFKEIGDVIDYNYNEVKSYLEDSDDDISLIYESFNKFISTIDGHRDHAMRYFYRICMRHLCDILYFSELDTAKVLTVDVHDLLLNLFTEWAENNEINILDIFTD